MPISNPSMPSVPNGVHVDDLTLDPCGLLITAHTPTVDATCLSCGRPSTRMHSAYRRTLKDLLWQDRAVTWRLRVRRFRSSHCPGRIFVERVPGLAACKARSSERLDEAHPPTLVSPGTSPRLPSITGPDPNGRLRSHLLGLSIPFYPALVLLQLHPLYHYSTSILDPSRLYDRINQEESN
jgi:hypothetical protein